MRIYTTLNRIRQADPCPEGWTKLLAFLNKKKADDEQLDLLTILESNGVQDCLWAFQCTDANESIYRHMAADFAESVLHVYERDYPNDNRPRLAIQAARDFADGKIDAAAWDADRAAAIAAAWDADRAAAIAAASGAASAAASAAAKDAAIAAAWDADRAAAIAAWDAAWDAELEKQKAIIIKYLS